MSTTNATAIRVDGPVREKVKPGIWRRKNAKGRWTYEIAFRDSDGRQRRQVVPGGMKAAETTLAEIKSKMGKGQRVAPRPFLTFQEASEGWLDAKSPNLSAKTLRAYRYALDVHLLPTFGRSRLDRLDVTVVAKFVARMATPDYRREVQSRNGERVPATTGYSVQTIKSVLIPLSRTFAYAKRHLGFAGENPVAALDLDERPGYRQHKQPKPKLGRDELDRLVAAADSPWREMFATAAALGTRKGETLGLCWRHIDFESGYVHIEQQANDKCQLARLKTETSRRRVEAPLWLLKALARVKLASPYSGPDDLVFPTRTGKPHRHGNVDRALHAALDRAGLRRVTFHAFRHVQASLWIKEGGEAIMLSKRLGHATPNVTMTVYADEIEEANDGATRKAHVERLFQGTGMAALLAAADGSSPQQTTDPSDAEIVSLTAHRSSPQHAAAESG